MPLSMIGDLIEAKIRLKEEEEKQMEKLAKKQQSPQDARQKQIYDRIFNQ